MASTNFMSFPVLDISTDFDMTLTKYWKDGKRSMSSHGVLEASSCLSQATKESLGRLYAKYYPIEVDPTISHEEKVKAMVQWWESAHDLIVEAKLTKASIQQMVLGTPLIN